MFLTAVHTVLFSTWSKYTSLFTELLNHTSGGQRLLTMLTYGMIQRALSCIQPLHTGMLLPNISHFMDMKMILTQTISRLSISLFQTTALHRNVNQNSHAEFLTSLLPEKKIGLYAA